MASSSVPTVGTRVNLQMFAGDILAHQGLVTVEHHPGSPGHHTVVLSDGAGVHVAVSGDRSSLAMILSAALADLGPEAPNPEATTVEEPE
jgi:hypothetical protein